MKFTKEEISLCKQVAEKHRKKIGEGDWYISKSSDDKAGWSPPLLNEDDYEPIKSKLVGIYDDKDRNDVPLWTILDCLKFLKEKGWWSRIDFDTEESRIYIFHKDLSFKHWTQYPMHKGKTPLEAYLKAVLAALEDE